MKTVVNMDTMRVEFHAADSFADALRRLNMTPIIDDDYPQIRHGYEAALDQLIEAMKANGRFDTGNRYRLVPRESRDFHDNLYNAKLSLIEGQDETPLRIGATTGPENNLSIFLLRGEE